MHKKWSAMKKLIWLKRSVLRAAVAILKTLTGLAPLLLGNASAKPIHSLTQYGKCEQDGTPTPDAPVDIVCNNGALKYSANMANVNEQTASIGHYINAQGAVLADIYNWYYQNFIPVKPNTTYTLSMSSPVYYVTISEYSTADDSGFIIRKPGTTGGNTSLTITTGANTNYIRFGTNLNRVVVTMEMVLSINWMLNIGGTAMDYQTYVDGGVYADGTPEVLTVGGKNLFDLATIGIEQGAIASADGVNIASNYRVRTVGYVPVKPSTQYAISAVIDGYTSGSSRGVFVFEYSEDSAESYIGSAGGWRDPNGYAFTTRAGTQFIRLVFAKDSSGGERTSPSDVSNIQLEYGDTATAYEPYVQPQTASVPMLLSVSDYNDEVELIHGTLTHKVGVLVFDGTEAWRASTSANIYILDSAIAVNLTAICTHFQKVSNYTSAVNMPDGSFKGHSSNAILYFKDVSAGNVDGFKSRIAAQYAAGTPVIVIYSLATETTEHVTPHHLHTSEGTNIVDVTSNVDPVELKAEYYATE